MQRIYLGVMLILTCLAVGLFSCAGGVPKTSDEQIVDGSLARLKMDSRINADNIHVESKNYI
ncbi:MAG TPA: hypothetical protein VNV63_03130, partial [Nitrospiria bacterium]|nr:hypothetical protein [Nitrospiria bacterium]